MSSNSTAEASLAPPFEIFGVPGDVLTAYAALFTMALLPIYIGAWRSLPLRRPLKTDDDDDDDEEDENEETERMTMMDAAMFPVYASCSLFGLYILFKYFGKEYVNLLLGGYFFILGVGAVTENLRPIALLFVPQRFGGPPFTLRLSRVKPQPTSASPGEAGEKAIVTEEEYFKLSFDRITMGCFVAACACGVWYLTTKHWIANNVFGLCFSLSGVAALSLEKFAVGAILLSGLFVYDIFWVFGTDVMVTVAKSFDAPIKVVFPKDFWSHGVFGTQHAMLGLGDIVIPGIFIALLLRFDQSIKPGSSFYFNATFIAYIIGLVTTIVVMHVFKAAQPALLYLVPACLTVPLLLAAARGHLTKLFLYEDNPKRETEEEKKVQ